MKTAKTILFLAFFCNFTTSIYAQITVDATKTATDLVNILANGNSCISISAENTIGDIAIPLRNSFGSFDKNGSSFPLNNGIILSTWSAKNSEGPFVRNIGGGSSGWGGDSDLKAALNSDYPTNYPINATALEFDFTAITNLISFDYIFASNEYQDNFACRFSDGFAFLIKDTTTGSAYTNLAVLPETLTPVSVYNVHPTMIFTDSFGAGAGCLQKNATYFNQLNTSLTNTSPINYAGQTTVLTAKTVVIPNHTYHIKLVIADDTFDTYDSAVFLAGGSFSSKIDLGSDRLLATNTPVCFGEIITLDAGFTDVNNTYKWFKEGSTTLLGINSTLSVIEDGTYRVEATISGCVATGEINIEFAPEIKKNNSTLTKCDDDGDGIAVFDLTNSKTELLNNNPAITTIEFFELKTGTILSNLIPIPTAFTKTSTKAYQTVYAQLKNGYGCIAIAEITLQTNPIVLNSRINPQPIINSFLGLGNSVTLVPPSTPGSYEFSLDGINYQNSPLFTNLIARNYTGFIKDSTTCTYTSSPFLILDYPSFFTPNDDGINEEWEIKNLDISYPNALISIFDRYGKLLKQISAGGGGWKGTFNGLKLPADDYWFTIDLKNGEITKGHFSLKR